MRLAFPEMPTARTRQLAIAVVVSLLGAMITAYFVVPRLDHIGAGTLRWRYLAYPTLLLILACVFAREMWRSWRHQRPARTVLEILSAKRLSDLDSEPQECEADNV